MSVTLPPLPYQDLAAADLTVGRVYKGGPQAHVGADPLHALLGVGNSGGFRKKTVRLTGSPSLCVLFSTGVVSEWPDGWGADGTYIYYGDQRSPDADVLDTPRKGNRLLAEVGLWVKRGEPGRAAVPPFFLFAKDVSGRDVRFEGLMVPASTDGWLTVQSRVGPEGTFVNYRAEFSRVAAGTMTRAWLTDVMRGSPHGPTAPAAWTRWVETGAVS